MNPWAIAGLGVVAWAGGIALYGDGFSRDLKTPGSGTVEGLAGGALILGGFVTAVTGTVIGVRDAAKPRRRLSR